MVSTTVNEETGEEKKRLINKMRWKGYGPISIPFAERQVRPTFAMRSCHFSSVCERSRTSLRKTSKTRGL
jgi:hypothetical protein